MNRDKKYIAILVLSIALVASGIGNIYLIYKQPEDQITPQVSRTLNVAISYGIEDLDSINAQNSRVKDVIDQVCEGLYTHDLSDPNLGIIPRLALDYGTWNPSGTGFTILLRRNITFHDGTPFNAEAVKWNFERINWFMNGTGTLNTTLSQFFFLWKFPNDSVILDPINPVTINSDYNVTINLRAPYGIIESLLCHVSASMLSPKSTPKYEYINTLYGRIIGTGPFVYDYYIANTEIKLSRWENYWRLPAFFEELNFIITKDGCAIIDLMMDHSVDCIIGSLPSLFCGTAYLKHYTISTTKSLSYYYLGFNNKRINKTWRQAISYAINYTYITEELQTGTVYRSNGPIAPNLPMHDPNIKSATWDLEKARQILVDAGITTLTANNDTTGPIADAWKAADFKSFNYSYNIGDDFREDLLIVLRHNLDLIGIEVIDQGMSWEDFIYRAYGYMEPGGYDSMELYWIGWGPDILSPYNMIAPLFSNRSASNSAQYYNHTVEMWFDEALSETNATKRAGLYSKILHQIVEVDMPHAFGYHPYGQFIHSTDLRGFPYNSMGSYYFYPTYRDSNS